MFLVDDTAKMSEYTHCIEPGMDYGSLAQRTRVNPKNLCLDRFSNTNISQAEPVTRSTDVELGQGLTQCCFTAPDNHAISLA